MTTVRRSIPTTRSPLSIEQRIARAAKKAELAAADAADAVVVAVGVDGRVDDVLAGDEAFTGLNVGGTDVKPFLDKTDGAKLTDSAGLDSGVVGTVTLAPNAATHPDRYDSVGETDWVAAGIATSAITTRATVFNTSITATGSEIIVDGSFFLRLQHSQDDVVLHVVVERTSTGGGGTVDVFDATTQSLAISGDGFISGWQVISFSDTPPAGTVDYYVRVYHTYSIGAPGGFVTWKHSNRTMSFLETKR